MLPNRRGWEKPSGELGRTGVRDERATDYGSRMRKGPTRTPRPRPGGDIEELLKRNVATYLPQVKAGLTSEPIGFGMWADRPEMQDAVKLGC